jgi:hypothetical protein
VLKDKPVKPFGSVDAMSDLSAFERSLQALYLIVAALDHPGPRPNRITRTESSAKTCVQQHSVECRRNPQLDSSGCGNGISASQYSCKRVSLAQTDLTKSWRQGRSGSGLQIDSAAHLSSNGSELEYCPCSTTKSLGRGTKLARVINLETPVLTIRSVGRCEIRRRERVARLL